jgi:hypothetical protein
MPDFADNLARLGEIGVESEEVDAVTERKYPGLFVSLQL